MTFSRGATLFVVFASTMTFSRNHLMTLEGRILRDVRDVSRGGRAELWSFSEGSQGRKYYEGESGRLTRGILQRDGFKLVMAQVGPDQQSVLEHNVSSQIQRFPRSQGLTFTW